MMKLKIINYYYVHTCTSSRFFIRRSSLARTSMPNSASPSSSPSASFLTINAVFAANMRAIYITNHQHTKHCFSIYTYHCDTHSRILLNTITFFKNLLTLWTSPSWSDVPMSKTNKLRLTPGTMTQDSRYQDSRV